jgi:hypothetical protein
VAKAYRGGKADAKKDMAKGVLAIEQAGYYMKWDQDYVRLFMRPGHTPAERPNHQIQATPNSTQPLAVQGDLAGRG